MLEEYASERWGALGAAYFRLDGTTNRIAREMDMRSFNASDSSAFLYLISTRAGGQGIITMTQGFAHTFRSLCPGRTATRK